MTTGPPSETTDLDLEPTLPLNLEDISTEKLLKTLKKRRTKDLKESQKGIGKVLRCDETLEPSLDLKDLGDAASDIAGSDTRDIIDFEEDTEDFIVRIGRATGIERAAIIRTLCFDIIDDEGRTIREGVFVTDGESRD